MNDNQPTPNKLSRTPTPYEQPTPEDVPHELLPYVYKHNDTLLTMCGNCVTNFYYHAIVTCERNEPDRTIVESPIPIHAPVICVHCLTIIIPPFENMHPKVTRYLSTLHR